MTFRDRAGFAAITCAVAAAMAIAGSLAAGSTGFLGVVGTALIALGALGLIQGLAVGLGLITPPYLTDEEDRSAIGRDQEEE